MNSVHPPEQAIFQPAAFGLLYICFSETMAHLCGHSHASRHRRELPAASPAHSKPPKAPSHEEIARLAYTFWESRGRPQGSDVEDWLRAERELKK